MCHNRPFEKIRLLLADQLDIDEDEITEESHLVEDLGADSLDSIDIIMSVEDEWEIEVPDDVLENIETVGDIVKYIEENI